MIAFLALFHGSVVDISTLRIRMSHSHEQAHIPSNAYPLGQRSSLLPAVCTTTLSSAVSNSQRFVTVLQLRQSIRIGWSRPPGVAGGLIQPESSAEGEPAALMHARLTSVNR